MGSKRKLEQIQNGEKEYWGGETFAQKQRKTFFFPFSQVKHYTNYNL